MYWIVAFFPWWSIPVAAIFFELGRTFRKKGAKVAWVYFGSTGFLLVLLIAYFLAGGGVMGQAVYQKIIGN
jgi:hypothetical protein